VTKKDMKVEESNHVVLIWGLEKQEIENII